VHGVVYKRPVEMERVKDERVNHQSVRTAVMGRLGRKQLRFKREGPRLRSDKKRSEKYCDL